ncbi:hypothetical protein NW754_005777 [Fusarium falciforme]|nr:hypothetical protein NW754_005777 [Fusarium falciforme]
MGTYNPSRSNGSTEHHVPSPRDAEQDSNGPRGLEESIQSRNSRGITHKPMTLDQYYYPVLTNTDVRDNDQVLSKFLNKKREQVSQARGENQNGSTNTTENDPSARGQALQKQIWIVDQLWMWIVDESEDTSYQRLLHTVLDNMIHGESRSRFERPTSVHSIMELILGCATGFFMKKLVPVVDDLDCKDLMEVFLESIRDVANEETRLFDTFRKALEDGESQRDELRNRSGNTPSVKQMPQNPCQIISPETALLHQIRDIRDEPRMFRSITEDQEIVWKQAFGSDVWKEVFDLGDLKDGLQYYHPCTLTDVKKDLDDMVVEAEVTNDSINTLLDLKQKQASIKEAEFSRIQANGSARQSNSVFIFTVITIVLAS